MLLLDGFNGIYFLCLLRKLQFMMIDHEMTSCSPASMKHSIHHSQRGGGAHLSLNDQFRRRPVNEYTTTL